MLSVVHPPLLHVRRNNLTDLIDILASTNISNVKHNRLIISLFSDG